MREALLKIIGDPAVGIVARGEFVLKSGASTDIYINMRSAMGHPHVLAAIAEEVAGECREILAERGMSACSIVGVPTGAIALATLVASRLSLPTGLVYKQPKAHGSGRRVEGISSGSVGNAGSADSAVNTTAIIIEDVYTTGGSIRECAAVLEASGVRVIGVVVVICRAAAMDLPWPARALFTLDDLRRKSIDTSAQHDSTIESRPSRVLLAMDRPVDLEPLLPWIAGVKLHSDLLPLTPAQYRMLRAHGKFILEDAKIADIGDIALRQIARYALAMPPDAITIHALTLGEWARGSALPLVVVREMSCESIVTPGYIAAADRLIQALPNVIGVVTQSSPAYDTVTFTPGINMDAAADSNGQRYSTGANADFIIVGRGITAAPDQIAAAMKYARGTPISRL